MVKIKLNLKFHTTSLALNFMFLRYHARMCRNINSKSLYIWMSSLQNECSIRHTHKVFVQCLHFLELYGYWPKLTSTSFRLFSLQFSCCPSLPSVLSSLCSMFILTPKASFSLSPLPQIYMRHPCLSFYSCILILILCPAVAISTLATIEDLMFAIFGIEFTVIKCADSTKRKNTQQLFQF